MAWELFHNPPTNTLARKPSTDRRECVAIEAHDADTHVRAHREIIHRPGRDAVLGALSPIELTVSAIPACEPPGTPSR